MGQGRRVAAPRKVPPDRPGPSGGRRDENRRRRTQDLVDAGLALFLEHGLEAVTIDDITRRAGIAKGSFYRYFEDKADLVDAVVAPMAGEFRSALRRCALALGKADGAPEALTGAYLTLAAELSATAFGHKDAVRFFLQEHRAPTLGEREGLRGLSSELSKAAIHLSQVAVDHRLIEVEDPRVSALAVLGAVEHLGLHIFRGELDVAPERIARIVVGMVLDGIRARRRPGPGELVAARERTAPQDHVAGSGREHEDP
jgi:AcrR family transcriptional regulator